MRSIKLDGSSVEAYAIKNKHDMLCGLVTKLDDGRWKIELLMRWLHHESTLDRALAWVRGVMTVVEGGER